MRNVIRCMSAMLAGVWLTTAAANAEPLDVDWLVQYCNESIQTADLTTQPRMLRNISNSLMTDAPDFLDGAIYLQRRNSFTDLCPELEGIGEPSREWLRHRRVTLSEAAVVVAAVREDLYPGAAALLASLGWTALGETISLGYVDGAAAIPLYAGLVPAGAVRIAGADVDALRNSTNVTITSHYYFFQTADAFAPETLAALQSVSIPEPNAVTLAALGMAALAAAWLRSVRADRVGRSRCAPNSLLE